MGRLFKEIAAKQLDMYLNSNDTLIIDVRDEEDFKKKHIVGAINVPVDILTSGTKGFNKNKILVLYCDRGGSSYIAARYLVTLGYNVIVVVGGLHAYRGNNLVE